jgi:hypothetical protein
MEITILGYLLRCITTFCDFGKKEENTYENLAIMLATTQT